MNFERRLRYARAKIVKQQIITRMAITLQDDYEKMSEESDGKYFDNVLCIPNVEDGIVEIEFYGSKKQLEEWLATQEADKKKMNFAKKRMGLSLEFGNVEKL